MPTSGTGSSTEHTPTEERCKVVAFRMEHDMTRGVSYPVAGAVVSPHAIILFDTGKMQCRIFMSVADLRNTFIRRDEIEAVKEAVQEMRGDDNGGDAAV